MPNRPAGEFLGTVTDVHVKVYNGTPQHVDAEQVLTSASAQHLADLVDKTSLVAGISGCTAELRPGATLVFERAWRPVTITLGRLTAP